MKLNSTKLVLLASTSLVLSCGFSHAADLQVKARVAPIAVSDPWVGWYAGANIGYSWGKADTNVSVRPFLVDDLNNNGAFAFPGGANSTRSTVNGVIGGAQLGYVGRIAPHWLGGIEADIQGSGQKGSSRGGFAGTTDRCTFNDCSFAGAHDVTAKLDWFGTFRGRVGPEFNGVWIYGTAGFAYGKVSVSGNNTTSFFDNNNGFAPPTLLGTVSTPFSYSQLKGGWTAGVGAEGLLGNGPWRWKVEYLHVDLGNINGGIFGVAPLVQVNTTRFTDEIVRVGLNYKFGENTPASTRMVVKAPPPALLTWTGGYVGVNAGYLDSVGRTNTDAPFSFADSRGAGDAGNLANTATNQFNHGPNGFIGGVQAGYNYQFSPSFVAGLEADIQGTTLRRDYSAISTASAGTGPFASTWTTTTAVSNRLDYLGTVRARVGVTPAPNVLLYSTGGLAYGGVRSSTQINFANNGNADPGATAGSFSGTRFGWSAGGGIEWMFAPNWTAKLEYLYYDLGSVSYPTGGYATDLTPTTFAGFGVVSLAPNTTTRFEGNIARVGLNYKFGGGPAVAKY